MKSNTVRQYMDIIMWISSDFQEYDYIYIEPEICGI